MLYLTAYPIEVIPVSIVIGVEQDLAADPIIILLKLFVSAMLDQLKGKNGIIGKISDKKTLTKLTLHNSSQELSLANPQQKMMSPMKEAHHVAINAALDEKPISRVKLMPRVEDDQQLYRKPFANRDQLKDLLINHHLEEGSSSRVNGIIKKDMAVEKFDQDITETRFRNVNREKSPGYFRRNRSFVLPQNKDKDKEKDKEKSPIGTIKKNYRRRPSNFSVDSNVVSSQYSFRTSQSEINKKQPTNKSHINNKSQHMNNKSQLYEKEVSQLPFIKKINCNVNGFREFVGQQHPVARVPKKHDQGYDSVPQLEPLPVFRNQPNHSGIKNYYSSSDLEQKEFKNASQVYQNQNQNNKGVRNAHEKGFRDPHSESRINAKNRDVLRKNRHVHLPAFDSSTPNLQQSPYQSQGFPPNQYLRKEELNLNKTNQLPPSHTYQAMSQLNQTEPQPHYNPSQRQSESPKKPLSINKYLDAQQGEINPSPAHYSHYHQLQNSRMLSNSLVSPPQGRNKHTINLRTTIQEIKQLLIESLHDLHVSFMIPEILLSPPSTDITQSQLHQVAETAFPHAGIHPQIINIRKYLNCILLSLSLQPQNRKDTLCILWHFNGKVYFGNWVETSNKELGLQSNNRPDEHESDSLEGVKEGHGLEWVPSRYAYYGQYRNHKKQGYGIMKKSNKEIYIGCWKNNQRHGWGKVFAPDGTLQHRGDFYEGNLVKEE